MHDSTPDSLRKIALKGSGKTVSKRALSKQSSLAPSRANSRVASAANSRNGSRINTPVASDDESEESGDGRSSSPNSIEKLMLSDETDPLQQSWQDDLGALMDKIVDRNWKTSNVQTRERAFATYIRALSDNFAKDELSTREHALVGAFMKSVKEESSVNETLLALKALSVTIVTFQSNSIYEAVIETIRRTIFDSASTDIKAEAIHTLGILTFYGDVSDDETLDNLALVLDIISSDGLCIDALDVAEPVAAALEEWGFLATMVDDLSAESEDAMETFVDQLSSEYASVSIAAGENIALLYEKAYTPQEEDEPVDETDEGNVVVTLDSRGRKTILVKRYDTYRRQDQLEHALDELSKLSIRSMSRSDKKTLHSTFADVQNSVQHPTRGPRYSTAIDDETGNAYGSRIKLKTGKGESARVDKWWQLHRLNGLKRVLQGGFMTHYQANEAVFDAVPIVFVAKPGKKEKRSG